MRRTGRPTSIRCAYTLVEALIVLAVLAVLTALVWPAVRGMLAKGELRGGAKQVRVALARARLDAIESGVPQAFRYRTGAGRFETTPLTTSANASEGASIRPNARRSRADARAEDELPRGVWFADARSARATDGVPPSTGRADEADWSAPIVFFPNGRSSHARIRLAGSSGFQVEVTLRGLTGTARIGPLERIEDGRGTAAVGRISNPSYEPKSVEKPPL